MFALPSVFSWPAVTKGRFPLVTAELTQARADPAPAREARPPAGRAPCSWGAGCCLHPSRSTPSDDPGLPSRAFPRHWPGTFRNADPPVGSLETVISGRAVDLSHEATWGHE